MELQLPTNTLVPRPYQKEALEALNHALKTRRDNPCVVLPTGSGKSLVIALAIKNWIEGYPEFRCIVLAHRQELVSQNYEEFISLGSGVDTGIYSAGLNRRDTSHAVTFAGIDSVHKRAGSFKSLDVIIVDEAHRIPVRGEGKYRSFIQLATLINPKLRVVGMTATPSRMGCGPICHKNHILNHVCYEANVGDLIRDGYLCKLRSKVSDESPDLANVKKSNGDYTISSLAEAAQAGDLVERAVANAIGHMIAEKRRSIIWFCVDVEHAQAVSNTLAKHGIHAPAITGKTRKADRERISRQFESRQIHHVTNCNIYTEGFNVKHIDCIVLLRSTLSVSLFKQMVGRGLRTHPDKEDCLVLDYAHCIETHGPIDAQEEEKTRLEICKECDEVFSRAVRICPACGWEIPKQEIERREAEEKEKKMHEERAAQMAILGSLPEELEVDSVSVDLHKKAGSPDSLRVSYRCGLRMFREWVCLNHEGYAGSKARLWWGHRFGHNNAIGMTTEKALQEMFLSTTLQEITKTITVQKTGKYYEIKAHKIEVNR